MRATVAKRWVELVGKHCRILVAVPNSFCMSTLAVICRSIYYQLFNNDRSTALEDDCNTVKGE
jgi:hypothetical protein